MCRGNKYQSNKLKNDIEQELQWYILKSKINAVRPEIYMTFIWIDENKRRDKDNVCFAKKFILDSLQKSKIIPNDNNKYIKGFRDLFYYRDYSTVIVLICDNYTDYLDIQNIV